MAENDILTEYDQNYALYNEFRLRVEALVKDILQAKAIRTHSISSRLKERNSFQEKINRARSKYTRLDDVTDLVGLRIITYFHTEVDEIAEVFRHEFDIDYPNSIDKRTQLDPDRFGYLSLHYVAKLSPERLQLTEYEQFAKCKFEIQIRSILQHAWAEIEHDTGYKSKFEIPKEVRRRFSRLASLLEVADDEFVRIREDLADYQKRVSQEITNTPDQVSIDRVSVLAYIHQDARIKELDSFIASALKQEVIVDENYIGAVTQKMHFVGLKTMSDVTDQMEKLGDIVARFAEALAPDNYYASWGKGCAGTALNYLCDVMVMHGNAGINLDQYLNLHQFWLGSFILSPTSYRRLRDRIPKAYSQAISDDAKS